MTQTSSNKTNLHPENKKNTLDLSAYYTFGFSLLKLMALLATIGFVIIGIYQFCSGGTAG